MFIKQIDQNVFKSDPRLIVSETMSDKHSGPSGQVRRDVTVGRWAG